MSGFEHSIVALVAAHSVVVLCLIIFVGIDEMEAFARRLFGRPAGQLVFAWLLLSAVALVAAWALVLMRTA